MCSWTLPCASSLVPSVLHLSHGFQCSPTLNRQPYEGRLSLTSWWTKIVKHDSWPIQPDILNATLLRLTSRKPLWLDLQPVDIKSRWRQNWKSAQVVNSHLVCDPTIRQPGFDLPRQQWSLLNRFPTEQRHSGACRRKWRLTDTDLCPCGETQTMSHIVESCPDKTEWRLISTTLCGWRRCFVAYQLWLWHPYEKKTTSIALVYEGMYQCISGSPTPQWLWQKHHTHTSEQVWREFYQRYVKNDDSAGCVTTAAHDDIVTDLCLNSTNH